MRHLCFRLAILLLLIRQHFDFVFHFVVFVVQLVQFSFQVKFKFKGQLSSSQILLFLISTTTTTIKCKYKQQLAINFAKKCALFSLLLLLSIDTQTNKVVLLLFSLNSFILCRKLCALLYQTHQLAKISLPSDST